MVSTRPSSIHSIVAVRRLSSVRKPSSPIKRPGGTSTLISTTRNLPVTVSSISLAASPALAILAVSHERLEPLHRHVALCCGARLLHESEPLTGTVGIDGNHQEIKKKGSDASGERTEDGEECAPDHVRDPQRHHRVRQQRGDKEDRADQG